MVRVSSVSIASTFQENASGWRRRHSQVPDTCNWSNGKPQIQLSKSIQNNSIFDIPSSCISGMPWILFYDAHNALMSRLGHKHRQRTDTYEHVVVVVVVAVVAVAVDPGQIF